MEYISSKEVKPLKKQKIQRRKNTDLWRTHSDNLFSKHILFFSEKVAFDLSEGERFICGDTCPQDFS